MTKKSAKSDASGASEFGMKVKSFEKYIFPKCGVDVSSVHVTCRILLRLMHVISKLEKTEMVVKHINIL